MRLLTALAKLRRRPWAERILLAEALGWLAVARIAIEVQRFERIAQRLGLSIGENTPSSGSALAEQIGWAVRCAALYTPWESACLVQALACAAMMRRRRLPGSLYLGMIKDSAGHYQAHAWVRAGDSVLTGGADLQRYIIVGVFGIPPQPLNPP